MLLWPSSLVMYFFCDVFFLGQANLLEILSEECSLIKIIWIVVIMTVVLDSMDSVSLWFQHL